MATSPSELARRIVALHARRNTAAGREADAAVACHPSDPNLLQLAGTIHCQAGRPGRGVELLRRAAAAGAANPTLWRNLARALFDLGHHDEAEAVCRSSTPSAELSWLLADIFRARGETDAAIGLLRDLVRNYPAMAEGWNNLANALLDSGAAAEAVDAIDRAWRLRPGDVVIAINRVRALAASGRHHEAYAAAEGVARAAPGNAVALLELGKALSRLGRHEQALSALGTAARIARTDPEIFVAIGLVYAATGAAADAEKAFRTAIMVKPDHAPAYVRLGLLFEQSNRPGDAATLVATAREARVADAELAHLDALALQRTGRFEEALAAAHRIPAISEPSVRAHLIGQLADRLDRVDDAFAAFGEMNRLAPVEQGFGSADNAAYRSAITALADRTTPQWFAGWTRPPTSSPSLRSPAFLVAMPRSGTTLLDTILMGHPDTLVLEEEPILEILQDEIGDLERLAAMEPSEVIRLRNLYFAEVDRIAPDRGGRLIVDKLPLNILRAPIVARLFPDARFVFAARHPCDVVLSCFMQNFRLNAAMANFLTIEDGARFYDRVLDYRDRSRLAFPNRWHDVGYEALIADPARETRALCAFLDLKWTRDMLDHQRTATARGYIRTPSYAQVSERLYGRSSGRWEGYRRHMEPVLPILAPWVEKMGYEPVRS